MATATLPRVWKGRSGRDYLPVTETRVRLGSLAMVRKVVARGAVVGSSTVEEGVPVALKQWMEGEDASLEMLASEAEILADLTARGGEDLPCPRLYDLVGDPVITGLVIEWCPGDLERWWRDKLHSPDAFGRLMATMAEAARRVSDYHVFYAQKSGLEAAHGNIKPSNVLLSTDGRWLISDFSSSQVRPPDDSPWSTSDVVMGTENFIAPELLFHAQKRYPPALDTWSLGASLFALLRLQRMVRDGSQVPRNGTGSPRFRMQRVAQVQDLYLRDPTRFWDRELDAEAFADPLRLPDGDRRALRDSLRGVFVTDDEVRERKLSDALLEMMDRAMSIDPAHRYSSARDLAAALENLTRIYIGLSAKSAPRGPGGLAGQGEPTTDERVLRAEVLEGEVDQLKQRLGEVGDALIEASRQIKRLSEEHSAARSAPPVPVTPTVPAWWGFVLLVLFFTQGLTMLIVSAAVVWVSFIQAP